jgi:hypothetical protein
MLQLRLDGSKPVVLSRRPKPSFPVLTSTTRRGTAPLSPAYTTMPVSCPCAAPNSRPTVLNSSPFKYPKRSYQSPPSGSKRMKTLAAKPLKDAAKPSMGATLFGLPTELRCLIYCELIDTQLPTPPCPFLGVNRQLRQEVHDWLASRKLTIAISDESCHLGRWDELVLQRAINIELDLSSLPLYPSHPVIDLMCRLWRKQCRMKHVSFSVLDDRIFCWSKGMSTCHTETAVCKEGAPLQVAFAST